MRPNRAGRVIAGVAASLIMAIQSRGQDSAVGDPALELAAARADIVRRAVQTITPSLVTIETIGGAQPVRQFGPGGPVEEYFKLAEGPTTGLILSSDGLILTSSFNFARAPSVITVTLHDGRRFVGHLLGRDLIRRLALVRITTEGLTPAAWAPNAEVRVGQYSIACGMGLGGRAPHISLGIVSAVSRRSGNALQTDAKLSPINYGGPLLDLDGRVLGLIVPIAGAGGALAGAEWYDSGIGFAVYRDRVDLVFDRLLSGQTIEPGKMGVQLQEDDADPIPILEKVLPVAGVIIGKVFRRSPAERAGLKAGDRIISLDGQSVGDVADVQRRLSDRAAGEDVKFTIKRRWQVFELTLRLAREADIDFADRDQPPTTQPHHGGGDNDAPTTQPEHN